MMVYNTVHIA